MPAAAGRDVRHDAAAHRFFIDVDGAVALLEYREIDATTLDYYRTYTPPALRGGGLASQITDHALRYARDHGYRVVARCPFVAAFIERHAEYRSLLP